MPSSTSSSRAVDHLGERDRVRPAQPTRCMPVSTLRCTASGRRAGVDDRLRQRVDAADGVHERREPVRDDRGGGGGRRLGEQQDRRVDAGVAQLDALLHEARRRATWRRRSSAARATGTAPWPYASAFTVASSAAGAARRRERRGRWPGWRRGRRSTHAGRLKAGPSVIVAVPGASSSGQDRGDRAPRGPRPRAQYAPPRRRPDRARRRRRRPRPRTGRRPAARSPAMIPVRTSPVPAVASQGPPVGQIQARPSGWRRPCRGP